VANILQQHQAIGGILDDDVVELGRVCEAANHAHRHLECLLRIRWRLAKLAGGYLDILLY